jgi:hypothetical protein
MDDLKCLAILVIAGTVSLMPTHPVHADEAMTTSTQSGSRTVTMSITLREDLPPLRITAREGEVATLEHQDVGKFEFKPTFKKDDATVVVVAILDAASSPSRPLAEVVVPVNGKEPVQSKTKPVFAIRIVRVTETK